MLKDISEYEYRLALYKVGTEEPIIEARLDRGDVAAVGLLLGELADAELPKTSTLDSPSERHKEYQTAMACISAHLLGTRPAHD